VSNKLKIFILVSGIFVAIYLSILLGVASGTWVHPKITVLALSPTGSSQLMFASIPFFYSLYCWFYFVLTRIKKRNLTSTLWSSIVVLTLGLSVFVAINTCSTYTYITSTGIYVHTGSRTRIIPWNKVRSANLNSINVKGSVSYQYDITIDNVQYQFDVPQNKAEPLERLLAANKVMVN
jgi:hypothetical protein